MNGRDIHTAVIAAIVALVIAVIVAIVTLSFTGEPGEQTVIIGTLVAFVAPTIVALLALLRIQDVGQQLTQAHTDVTRQIEKVEAKVENSNGGGNANAGG